LGTLASVIAAYYQHGPGAELKAGKAARALVERIFADHLSRPSLDVTMPELQLLIDGWRSAPAQPVDLAVVGEQGRGTPHCRSRQRLNDRAGAQNAGTGLALLKRIMKEKSGRPRKFVTDGLRVYSGAMKKVGNTDHQQVGRGLSDRKTRFKPF
jgi:hypothetical protein